MKQYGGCPVGFEKVSINGGFWAEKQKLMEDITIDALYKRFEETGRFEALKGEWREGKPNKPHIFWESDIAKWIEGVAYKLQKSRDKELEKKIDYLVDLMEAYQSEDGYLNIYFTVVEPEARFTRCTDHELYCAGHLIEAAIAYDKATGKDKFLKIMKRYADLIDKVFRIEHSAAFDTPGHEEIELALYKLYMHTGENRYLQLAMYFIDTRGTSKRDKTYDFASLEYMQSHLPVREQFTAEGHCVRALYLYSGMADLALHNKDESLYNACDKLFDNITQKRMYITGGLGSTYRGEAFTYDYDLPELTAYAETCASIALALFARRMWLISPNGKYADAAELAIYNTALSGVSLTGDSFFYENPLYADPKKKAFNDSRPRGLMQHLPIMERAKVFDCSCCPPNILRFIESIGDFAYSSSGDTVFAHCYMDSKAEIPLEHQIVNIEQHTQYPYDGKIVFSVKDGRGFSFALHIPEWARSFDIKVNDSECQFTLKDGYAYIDRLLGTGDMIELNLDMQIETVEANPEVRDICGRAALKRGPIVFCAEGADNRFNLRDVRIRRDTKWQIYEKEIANTRLIGISGPAEVRRRIDGLYSAEPIERQEVTLNLIPYHAWANRGVNEMNVWFLLKD
jgi:DUF1680 family protein